MPSVLSSTQETTSRAPGVDAGKHDGRQSGSTKDLIDVLCVGFGVTSLAVAVALADRTPEAKSQFFDRDPAFSWRQGEICPTNNVQTSFLRDLVTTSNPRSHFTFMNYLFQHDRLVAYTNLSALCPSKLEMQKYLTWVAKEIEKLGWVSYNREVIHIEPMKLSSSTQISEFAVRYRDTKTGIHSVAYTKRVIVATAPVSRIPTALAGPDLRPFVLHSSTCHDLLTREDTKSTSIAIVGASQEGAEIYEHLQSTTRNHRAMMFITEPTLQPLNNSAFSRASADEPRADMAHLPPNLRHKLLRDQSSRSPISMALIERLYELDYAQQICSSDRRFSVQTSSEVVGSEIVRGPKGRVHLLLKDTRTGVVRRSDEAFDFVIAATSDHEPFSSKLLGSIFPLADGGRMDVGRDYHVNLRRGVVGKGCGVWLLQSLVQDLSRDEMFLYLAEQGHRIASSILESLSDDAMEKPGQMETRTML